jgi:hypothetical protein
MMFQNSFDMFKVIANNKFFFQTSFFFIKCAYFLFKIGEDYNIDEIDKIHFLYTFEHICFNCVFDFENYEI